MSLAATRSVWEHSRQTGSALLVLLALADYADADGLCWPSMATLAAKARLSERMVARHVERLMEAGEVDLERGGGRGRSNRYRITLTPVTPFVGVNPDAGDALSEETPTPVTPFVEKGDAGDTLSEGAQPLNPDTGCGVSEKTLTPGTQTLTPVTGEPVVNRDDSSTGVAGTNVAVAGGGVRGGAAAPRPPAAAKKKKRAVVIRPPEEATETVLLDALGGAVSDDEPIPADRLDRARHMYRELQRAAPDFPASVPFWHKVARKWGDLDLEAEAMKLVDWMAKDPEKRTLSNQRIVTWLGKARVDDDEAKRRQATRANGHAPPNGAGAADHGPLPPGAREDDPPDLLATMRRKFERTGKLDADYVRRHYWNVRRENEKWAAKTAPA
jgi:hypothetical protein